MPETKPIKSLRELKQSYTLGKAQELWKCCRAIRYAGLSPSIYDILEGVNTNTEQREKWAVLKVGKSWSSHIVVKLTDKI